MVIFCLLISNNSKFSVNASVGASINDYTGRGTGFDSYPGTLSIPNVFVIGNVDVNGGLPSDWKTHTQSQSVFFTGQVGFMDQLYLDVTARNDWTSTLAFTKYKNKGFFYPSVGVTWLLNETLKLPEWIDLGKIRGAWSQVGNGLSSYISHPLNSISKNGNVNFNTTAPFDELKPERTTSINSVRNGASSIAVWSLTLPIIRQVPRISFSICRLLPVLLMRVIMSMPVKSKTRVWKLC